MTTDTDHIARSVPSLADVAARVDDALPLDGRAVSPVVARRVALDTMASAYAAGKQDALAGLMSTQEVATILGVTRVQVYRLARSRDLGWDVGRERLFRPEDVEAMRDRKLGRPVSARRSQS